MVTGTAIARHARTIRQTMPIDNLQEAPPYKVFVRFLYKNTNIIRTFIIVM